MALATLEVWHSRPIAPTRRVAVGDCHLPADPAPGSGGLLLGAVMARYADDLDGDLRSSMLELIDEVEQGASIGQPRLRHRLQVDRVGLHRSRHRLLLGPEGLVFAFETKVSAPAQSALAAVYACASFDDATRGEVLSVVRRGLEWVGPVGPGLIDHLVGPDIAMRMRSQEFELASNPVLWALQMLEIDGGDLPPPKIVQKHYRRLVRDAHPDIGGAAPEAADRLAELARAREILMT